jgi:chromosome segregation ATPase
MGAETFFRPPRGAAVSAPNSEERRLVRALRSQPQNLDQLACNQLADALEGVLDRLEAAERSEAEIERHSQALEQGNADLRERAEAAERERDNAESALAEARGALKRIDSTNVYSGHNQAAANAESLRRIHSIARAALAARSGEQHNGC